MPNALIFSPCLDGHRQVYAYVITNILKDLGFKIFVAGNLQEKITNSFYVNEIKRIPETNFIDTAQFGKGGLNITLPEFLNLQDKNNIDLTIFTEADFHFSLFISQLPGKKNRLRGKVVGIFMRPFYFYQRTNFLDKLRYLKQLPSNWKKDECLFFEFFLKNFSLLDIALTIDENYVHSNKNFEWLPDVFQQYADSIMEPDERSEQRKWLKVLQDFKEKNAARFILLYFGTSQVRRGYDNLLKLAVETGSSFIHCGLKDPKAKFDSETDEAIKILKSEKRILETNEFIEDPLCIETFFKSASHLILPYKDFYGSSGVMLQSLGYGIPVLVSDMGVVGYRVKKYNLGITYPPDEKDSLVNSFEQFKNLAPISFSDNIEHYMKLQSIDQLKNVLTNAFIGTKSPVNIP